MALVKLLMIKETSTGENLRTIREKHMENLSIWMERSTLASTSRGADTAMEYSYGQAGQLVEDNINRIREKVMHITGGQMAKSTMDSKRTICYGEKGYRKKMGYFTKSNMNKTT
jgi:hypothetical protein